MATTTIEETHVSKVFVAADYRTVWEYITDPMNVPECYPNWTTSVAPEKRHYRGVGTRGDEFTMTPHLDEESGVVDFEIDAGSPVERPRSRLFAIDEHHCLLIHLAVRWEGVDDHGWQEHKRETDEDLGRMKRLVEIDS
ncbi:hypothetical protein [Natronolimnohabitans innermongolicus]|uniref:Polyketide cyclase/dehydrase n=1 Tax=Natronolimnohabitans innermongolicus JCM 12255 TaxID=1227499 RepID=L9X7H8_9EURY|nr:hypothetical protein [Natronolimnohabitans innermongolicus]ELY57537.1 hypothetical protein C493_08636 [Natronolimnohabitans innermongolicus JCM 12255]